MACSTHWTRCPDRASLQMGCSARVSQNSHASSATFSSASCVRWSMYCRETRISLIHLSTVKRLVWHQMFHLYDAVHVWYQTVDSDLQQHDQSSAHVLPHLAVFITRQRKQRLKTQMSSAFITEITRFIVHCVWTQLYLCLVRSRLLKVCFLQVLFIPKIINVLCNSQIVNRLVLFIESDWIGYQSESISSDDSRNR